VTKLWIVDAFTDRPFAGNPTAIVMLDGPRPAAWRQAVAAEMNLSETAFVVPRSGGEFDLSWFTPTVEVELCGHATLASAYVLRATEAVDPRSTVNFQTRSGLLKASFIDDRVQLDFPACVAEIAPIAGEIVAALGVHPVETLANSKGYDVAVLAEPGAVRDLRPDHATLRALRCDGVIVTAPGDVDGGTADFVSRYFAPGAGIEEDPVTGSAHCVLAPLWRERLGRNPLFGHQVSARGGMVECEVVGDRVLLRGTAVIVLRGELSG